MRAAVCTGYGPPEVVQIQEVPTPIPGDNDVLIRIHATTVTSGDWRVRSLQLPRGFGFLGRLMFGFSSHRQPILGVELSGVIEAVGKDVTQFQVGDAVFAYDGSKMGCHAEYKCLPADGPIVLKPANLSHEEAAALSFGGATMLDFFRRGELKAGESVLVNGASGGVGTAAVQLARHVGAEVTAVCSGANAELVRSLGAHHVIDYTQADFTAAGKAYDVIVDTVGTAPYSRSKRALKEDGRLLVVLGTLGEMLNGVWVTMTTSRRVISGPAAERLDDLQHLAQLAEAGDYRPYIHERFTLDTIVDAHRLVDTGRKKGNVVVII